MKNKVPLSFFDSTSFERLRAEILKKNVGILAETVTPKGHFEIN